MVDELNFSPRTAGSGRPGAGPNPMGRGAGEQQQMSVDLSEAPTVHCDNCGGVSFQPVFLFKRMSKIISPTGEEGIVPVQTFQCTSCGFMNKEFLPFVPAEDESDESAD